MRKDVGRANVLYVHVTLLPALAATGELKTKPTQHSVKELRGIGIQPDVIVLRCDQPVGDEIRDKIALFTDVACDAVIPAETADTIYEVPLQFEDVGPRRADRPRAGPRRSATAEPDLTAWRALVDRIKRAQAGRSRSRSSASTSSCPTPTSSVTEALRHAGWAHERRRQVRWVDSEALDAREPRTSASRAWPASSCPGGFGHRGIEGKVLAARYAREHRVPYLGLCLGLQCAVIEFARDVVGTDGRQLDRVRHVHRAPGDRPHARPARHGGQGRHDAPRPLPGAS